MAGATALLLSPHPDDLAWSVGGTVAKLCMVGVDLVGLTFFTRTRYAPGSTAHGTTAATEVRAAEESEWAAQVGLRLERADLADASLRGYDDDSEMGPEPEPEIVERVAGHLRAALDESRPRVVLAPLAIGGHVDHRAVQVAALALPSSCVLFYEDLPYSFGSHEYHLDYSIVVDVAAHTAAREAGIDFFASQRPETILPVLRRHTAAVSGERFWARTSESTARLRALFSAPDDHHPHGRRLEHQP